MVFVIGGRLIFMLGWLVSVMLFISAIVSGNELIMIAAGLFAIAGEIELRK